MIELTYVQMDDVRMLHLARRTTPPVLAGPAFGLASLRSASCCVAGVVTAERGL